MATPVTPAVADAVKKILVGAASDLFGQARAGVAELANTGEFIAGPVPSNPILAYQHRVGRAVCDRWARGERFNILPGNDLVLRASCEDYLAGDAPGQPVTAPPFEGGQCSAFYTVQWQQRSFSQAQQAYVWGNTITSGQILGPLRIVPGGVSGAACGSGPGQTVQRWNIQGASSSLQLFSGCTDIPPGYRNVVVNRVGGFPDNCGSLADEFNSGTKSPSPLPNPGPVPGIPGYPFPDIEITIGPDGDIVFDFGDGEDPEVVTPGDDGGGGGGADVAPTSPGDAAESEDSGDGGVSEGCAPEGQELTGVLVRVLEAHENANKLDRAPVPIFRGVGYVSMGYPGLLGVDTSAAVVESPQFFHAQQRGLTCWRVRANVGFNLESTPYYREIEQ